MPTLRFKSGPNKGKVYELTDDRVTIGRDPVVAVQILDQSASREHAEVYRVGDMYFLKDLDSRNGTLLNEEPVTESLLREGDKIRIGATVIVFERRKIATDQTNLEFHSEDLGATMELNLNTQRVKAQRTNQEGGDLSLLYEAAKFLSSADTEEDVMRKVVELAVEATNADSGYVFIRDESGQRFIPKAVKQKGEKKSAVKISRTIIKRVLTEQRSLLTTNAGEDARFKANQSVVMKRIHAVICAPLVSRAHVNGVLYLSTDTDTFKAEDLEFITILGMQAGISIENLQSQIKQQEFFMRMVRTLVNIVEMKDPANVGHADRVLRYVTAVGKKLGFSTDDLNHYQLAALLHDVGKAGMSDEKINDAASSGMFKTDLGTQREHVEVARKLLHGQSWMEDVLPGIIYHHERLDGSGPFKLAGEDIPMIARVVGLCNDFDTLTTKGGPNNDGLDVAKAIERLQASLDHYDKVVVEALTQANNDGTLYKESPEPVGEDAAK